MSEKPQVQIGQVYRDKDKRMSSGNRYVLVVATNGGRLGNKAVCVPCYSDGHRSTTHTPANLQKRFELISDPPSERKR